MRRFLIVFLILFAFVLIYLPHFDNPGVVSDMCSSERVSSPGYYPYPLHADEWAHLALSKFVVDTGSFPSENVFVGVDRVNPQSGFHVFVASLFLVTGLDIIYFYQFLAAIFAVLTCLFIFLIIERYSGSYVAGFFGALFFLSIQSNINIMGSFFFLPHTFSFFLLVAFLYFFVERFYYLCGLVFLISLISYPMVSVLLFVIFFFGELFRRRFSYWFLVLPIFLLFTAIVLYGFDFGALWNVVIFEKGWTEGFEFTYGLFDLVPFTLYFFGLVGLVGFVRMRKFLLLGVLFPLLSILFYVLFDFSFFIPYQRALWYFFIGLSLFAGFGVFLVLDFVWSFLKGFDWNFLYLKRFLFVVFLFVFLFVSFSGYYDVDNRTFVIIHWACEESVEVFSYVGDVFGSGNLMVVDAPDSFFASAVSGNYLLAVPPSNLEFGSIDALNSFFASSCSDKEDFIRNRGVDLIVSRHFFDCGFDFVEKNGYFIYKT